MFVLTFFTDTSHLRLSYLHETWIQCEQATATSDTVWQILREDEEGRKEVHRERLEPMGGSSGGGVEGGLFRDAGTVCGRPLAHTPALLSTLLTLLTPRSPGAPALLPAPALCARIISEQRRRRRWSNPCEGSLFLPPPLPVRCLSSLAACILCLFSPRRGDTKRHLPGRDKPIFLRRRGGGRDLMLPASPPLVAFISLPLLLLLQGRAALLGASSTISASVVCAFWCLRAFVFCVCACVC